MDLARQGIHGADGAPPVKRRAREVTRRGRGQREAPGEEGKRSNGTWLRPSTVARLTRADESGEVERLLRGRRRGTPLLVELLDEGAAGRGLARVLLPAAELMRQRCEVVDGEDGAWLRRLCLWSPAWRMAAQGDEEAQPRAFPQACGHVRRSSGSWLLLVEEGRGDVWLVAGWWGWMDGSMGLGGRGDRGRRRLRLVGAKGIWEDPEVGDECGGGGRDKSPRI